MLLLAFFLHNEAFISILHLNAIIDFTSPFKLLDLIDLSSSYPLISEFLTFSKHSLVAFVIFALASSTDFLDGFLARRFKITSVFGEVFDPLADKMLILACFIGLLIANKASPWAVFLIFSREFFITGLRVVVASQKSSVKASMLGKIKTLVQLLAICFLLLDLAGGDFLLWAAAIITLYSGLDYALMYYKNIKTSL